MIDYVGLGFDGGGKKLGWVMRSVGKPKIVLDEAQTGRMAVGPNRGNYKLSLLNQLAHMWEL